MAVAEFIKDVRMHLLLLSREVNALAPGSYLTETSADLLYLRLDTANDPLTNDLQIDAMLRINEGSDISPSASADGQLRIDGNAYSGYVAMDLNAMHFGHNSASRALIFQTDETTRFEIPGNGNTSILRTNLNISEAGSAAVQISGGPYSLASDRFTNLQSDTNLDNLEYGLAINDTETRRARLFLSDENNVFGLQSTAGSGTAPEFRIYLGNTLEFSMSNSAATLNTQLDVVGDLNVTGEADFFTQTASAQMRIGRNANENFRFDVTDSIGTITYDQDETNTTNHSFIFNIESGNTSTRNYEWQNNGVNILQLEMLSSVERFWLRNGYTFRISDSTDVDHIEINHDGTNAIFDTAGAFDFKESISITPDAGAASLSLAPELDEDAYIELLADPGGTTDTSNPYIYFRQDAVSIDGVIGFAGAAATDSRGNTVTDVGDANSFVIHSDAGGTPIHLAVNNRSYLQVNDAAPFVRVGGPTLATNANLFSIESSTGQVGLSASSIGALLMESNLGTTTIGMEGTTFTHYRTDGTLGHWFQQRVYLNDGIEFYNNLAEILTSGNNLQLNTVNDADIELRLNSNTRCVIQNRGNNESLSLYGGSVTGNYIGIWDDVGVTRHSIFGQIAGDSDAYWRNEVDGGRVFIQANQTTSGTNRNLAVFDPDLGCDFYHPQNGGGSFPTSIMARTRQCDASGRVSGFEVRDHAGVLRQVGFGVAPVFEQDANDTFDVDHANQMWHKDSGGAVSYTCANTSDIPNGAFFMVANEDSENLSIVQGSGVTIRWFDGSGGTPPTGGRTVAQAGYAVIYKYTDTEYWMLGGVGVT